MGESRTKVSTVNRTMSIRFGRVDIFAAWTVEFHGFLVGGIGETNRKEGLGIAEYPRASPKICFAVFVELIGASKAGAGKVKRGIGREKGWVKPVG